MSLLRALRAYVGLGPDEDYEIGGLAPSRSSRTVEGRSLVSTDEYWNYGAGSSERSTRAPRQGERVARRTDDDGQRVESHGSQLVAAESSLDQEAVIDLRSGPESVAVEDEWDETLIDDSDDAVVRSLAVARARPKTVSPESFAEAKELADEFRTGIPVVLNLHGLERNLARRLIDFASGVCYCMDGTMEKIGAGVFLLTPDGIEVAEEDRLRIQQRGYAR